MDVPGDEAWQTWVGGESFVGRASPAAIDDERWELE
jgi:hypothetical protein